MGANIVSPTHLLLVLLVVVLVFGTKKLPEFGRGLGSSMREFKEGINGTSAEPEPVRQLEAQTGETAQTAEAAERPTVTAGQSQ